MSSATAAKRWTCDRCGMAVGQIDGTPVPLPESLGERRRRRLLPRLPARASRRGGAGGDAATSAVTDVRAKARRAGLIEFEVRQDPDPHRQHDRQGLPHQRLGGRRRAASG